MCAAPEDWPWASYGAAIGLLRRIRWSTRVELLEPLRDTPGTGASNARAIVEEADPRVAGVSSSQTRGLSGPEQRDDLVVEQAVRRDEAAAGARCAAVERRAAAARFLDHDLHRRRSPTGSCTESHATSSAPSATRQCCQKSPSPRFDHARRDELAASRPACRARRRRRDRCSPRCAATARDAATHRRRRTRPRRGRPPAPAERRRRHEAEHDRALALEREQRRPHRHAAHVVHRPVDRVDDPLARRPPSSPNSSPSTPSPRPEAAHAAPGSPPPPRGRPRRPASGRASSRRAGPRRGTARA